MKELAQLAHERGLSRCIDALHAEILAWKKGEMAVWDVEQSIHEFHNKTARNLYRSYVMVDTFLAVAFGIAQGVISLEEIPESEKEKIHDASESIKRSMNS